MKRVVVIDNHDSFTHNLVQALRVLGAAVRVLRAGTVAEALADDPTHVVISPGPGRPEDARFALAVLAATLETHHILGVCLGHQALVHLLGGTVGPARQLMHGKASQVHHDGRTLYADLPQPFVAGRYHSLAATALPPALAVSAWTQEGEIMGVRHERLPVEGVQFHPESILTPEGDRLLARFLGVRTRG